MSREILRADGARTIEFGRHEEGRLDFARAQMLYTQACDLLRGVDDEGETRARNALDSLVDREAEMAEMLALSNTAARGLFEQRADMLCRQARDRPQEKHGGPSIEQFDASVASNPPAVMRESVMGSYGARMVFRPSLSRIWPPFPDSVAMGVATRMASPISSWSPSQKSASGRTRVLSQIIRIPAGRGTMV